MKYQTLSFFVGAGSSKNMLGITTTDASAPDLDKFNQHLTECCNKLHDAGYEVAHIVPLQIGTATKDGKTAWPITRGAAVVGRLCDRK